MDEMHSCPESPRGAVNLIRTERSNYNAFNYVHAFVTTPIGSVLGQTMLGRSILQVTERWYKMEAVYDKGWR